MTVTPNELDYWRRGEVWPGLQTLVDPEEMDYFRRSETLPVQYPVAAAAGGFIQTTVRTLTGAGI